VKQYALIVIGLLSFQGITLAAVPSAERDALVTLYNSTNGASWSTNTNWLNGDPCINAWYGVSCDLESKITRVTLHSNNIVGTIPPELGSLNNLEWLWLFDNKLSGAIPGALGDLANLEKLDLADNELSGSIPSALGNLTNLEWLELNNNQLSGSIPGEMGGMTNLSYLIADDNQLDGTIPPELGNLINLKWIWLDDNKLSGSIPSEIGNLANLEQLDLDGNQLSGSIPGTLEGLVNLNDGFGLSLRWNALYTFDAGLDDFLNGKAGVDWSSTQTTAPENISVTKAGVNAVSLVWEAIEYTSNAGRYTVFYGTSAGGTYVEGGSTANKSVTSLSVTGLEPETTYYFVIQSITDSHTFNQNNVASEFSHQKIVDTVSVGSIFRDGFEER
jgi:hypothetical protein